MNSVFWSIPICYSQNIFFPQHAIKVGTKTTNPCCWGSFCAVWPGCLPGYTIGNNHKIIYLHDSSARPTISIIFDPCHSWIEFLKSYSDFYCVSFSHEWLFEGMRYFFSSIFPVQNLIEANLIIWSNVAFPLAGRQHLQYKLI